MATLSNPTHRQHYFDTIEQAKRSENADRASHDAPLAYSNASGQTQTNVRPQSAVERCRICYEPGSLISVCDCGGSMKYVHRECLVRWMASSGRRTCEICHAAYRLPAEQRRSCACAANQVSDIILCASTILLFTILAIWLGIEMSTHL